MSSAAGKTTMTKKQIMLSLSLSDANTSIGPSDLYEGCVIRGKILLVEDHGCALDLDMSGAVHGIQISYNRKVSRPLHGACSQTGWDSSSLQCAVGQEATTDDNRCLPPLSLQDASHYQPGINSIPTQF